MPDKNQQQVEEIFHTALDLGGEERAAYLAEACAGDQSLYAEVNSLISALENSNGLMEQPELRLGMEILSGDAASSSSMTGKTIGAYRVLELLGQGGMGKVYLAEDTRLGRKVALKFLSGEFVGDNWARRQLVREAQAVAKLDHPNICPVYGIEESDGHSFIVMQYVEGETLGQLIRNGPLSPSHVVDLAQQIAGAIAEAHAHGIIHRDIKPKNIMVTPGGQVRVLDFGLAKTIQQQHGLDGAADSISHMTQAGLLVGTVSYMSPEQLRGETLDYSSDIFSVGTVVYEMLSGRNPYAHENTAETISAILASNPPLLRASETKIPRELDRVVQRCIQKEKEKRYQSAGDFLFDLETAAAALDRPNPLRRLLSVRIAAAAALIALLAIASAFVYFQLTIPKSVAVLPLANESGDASLEYISDGLTESITNKLFGLSRLRVKAATLVSGYKGKITDAQKIGRELGVDAVLVGAISGTKELTILEVKLISVETGAEMWKDRYSIDQLRSVFSAEEDVSHKVVSKLEFRSGEDERRIRTVKGPQNAEARKEYWLGRYYWRIRDNNHTLDTAIQHFDAAIRLAPNYAEAHAGLADCYAFYNVVAYGQMATKEAMSKAERAAKDALELDPTLPEAHTSLATVNLKYYWNWQEAEAHFRQAIALKPDYAPAHYGYANLLIITRRANEAVVESQIAKDLDPFSPATALGVCKSLYFARRFDQATGCFDKMVQERPDFSAGKYSRGLMYLQQAKYPQATAIFEELYRRDKRLAGAALGYTYGVTGRSAEARQVLSEMQALSKPTNLPPQEIALIYLGLGDLDNAFPLLEQSAEQHFAPFATLPVDPLFEKLHSDPRFVEIIQRHHLPTA